MINIALPKGRLGEKVYEKLAKAGYGYVDDAVDSRKLIFQSADGSVSYFWVKPSDVAIYVEKGAADIGVVGKDILLEYSPDVYEILDLNIGKCKMAVAAKNGYKDDSLVTLKVATKFPNIAKEYYEKQNRDIELIKLNGSIELAPILKMSDVIVDIVETGTTLKENDLLVIADVCPISTRLIANKASYKFKKEEIDAVKEKLK
ncbi:MAG: ATP phosphoribosyltransferase [Christensenellales bacterium]